MDSSPHAILHTPESGHKRPQCHCIRRRLRDHRIVAIVAWWNGFGSGRGVATLLAMIARARLKIPSNSIEPPIVNDVSWPKCQTVNCEIIFSFLYIFLAY